MQNSLPASLDTVIGKQETPADCLAWRDLSGVCSLGLVSLPPFLIACPLVMSSKLMRELTKIRLKRPKLRLLMHLT